jgi:beta-lysine 5,6-aminomutase beta subunit
MKYDEINRLIKEKINRKLTVIGASIGSDAHTVGIDAIMNMKGFNHDYGLERYPLIKAVNLGSQVETEDLIKKAVDLKADAVLVSQIVTQQDAHKENASQLISSLKKKKLHGRFILILGGPRITNDLALELGFDAGFGPQTLPSHVASFIVRRIIERKG